MNTKKIWKETTFNYQIRLAYGRTIHAQYKVDSTGIVRYEEAGEWLKAGFTMDTLNPARQIDKELLDAYYASLDAPTHPVEIY